MRPLLNKGASFDKQVSFPSYDESFTSKGKETCYFDGAGKLMSHKNAMTNMLVHEIFFNKRVLVYTKIGKDVNSADYNTDQVADFIIAEGKFKIDYYLSNFKELHTLLLIFQKIVLQLLK